MKANATWVKGFQSIIDNDRCHSVVIDLPASFGGQDLGAKALEVTLMSLAGCITTIYAMMASKMRVEYDSLVANLEGEQAEGADTITKVIANVKITNVNNSIKAKKCFEMTLEKCPVGIIFKNAGIELIENLEITEAPC